MSWKSGKAEIRSVKGLQIVVACPHCYGLHTHSRSVLGSRSAAAGCHAGRSRCREYSIPKLNTGRTS